MLTLIYKGGYEYMKALVFQLNIVGADACMKKIMRDTKGCDQLSSNGTFFDYIWFSIVKTAD